MKNNPEIINGIIKLKSFCTEKQQSQEYKEITYIAEEIMQVTYQTGN